MAIWQWALICLVAVWALQSVGVWLQMRHYADVFKGVQSQFDDGFVGAGHARGRLRRGTIALLVVDSHLVVRRVMTMTGRTVFAKFTRNPEFEGMTLADLSKSHDGSSKDCTSRAIAIAIQQIQKARAARDTSSNENGRCDAAIA